MSRLQPTKHELGLEQLLVQRELLCLFPRQMFQGMMRMWQGHLHHLQRQVQIHPGLWDAPSAGLQQLVANNAADKATCHVVGRLGAKVVLPKPRRSQRQEAKGKGVDAAVAAAGLVNHNCLKSFLGYFLMWMLAYVVSDGQKYKPNFSRFILLVPISN